MKYMVCEYEEDWDDEQGHPICKILDVCQIFNSPQEANDAFNLFFSVRQDKNIGVFSEDEFYSYIEH